MWQLLNTPAYAPFIVAGLLLIILLAIEILGFFFGGLSGLLDRLIPNALLEADTDVSLHGDMNVGLKFLDWLYVGRIPTTILLIQFIGCFSITGLMIQQLSSSFLNHYLSPWLASLDAIVLSIPLLKVCASLVYPILPKDETSAISSDALIGKPAVLTIGYASVGNSAEAKIIDEYGQTHYVMVQPDPIFINDNIDTTNKLSISKDTHFFGSNSLFSTEDTLMITNKVGGIYLAKKV